MAKFSNMNNCVNCKVRCEVFSLLTEDQLNELHKERHEVRYGANENIFKQGTFGQHLVSLNRGLAKKYIEGIDSKRIIIGIIKPQQIVFWPGMFIDNRHHFSLTAVTESFACFIDIDLFKRFMKENEKFNERVLMQYSLSNIDTFELMMSLTQKQMHGRMAENILYLADNVFGADDFNIIFSRQELSEMVGISKESTSRILNDLKTEKIIEIKGNSLKIINKKQLRNISRTG